MLTTLTSQLGCSLEEQVAPSISPLCLSLDGVVGRIFNSILNLYILLGASEDVPHLSDLLFHHMLIEGVGDLQLTDEHGGSHIDIAVMHQCYLALKITNIVFEAISGLHLDCEEVVVILLELPSGSILVIESLLQLFEAPERLFR